MLYEVITPRWQYVQDFKHPFIQHVSAQAIPVSTQAFYTVDACCTHKFAEFQGPAVYQV